MRAGFRVRHRHPARADAARLPGPYDTETYRGESNGQENESDDAHGFL